VVQFKLQGLFAVDQPTDANIFLNGAPEEKHAIFSRFLDEAREETQRYDRDAVWEESDKQKKKKKNKKKESSESSESSESMIYDLTPASSRRDVDRLFPAVGELSSDYQFKDYAKDE